MNIDFNQLKVEELERFKDGEGSYLMQASEDEKHKIMKGRLKPGSSIGYHSHEVGSEIIYIIEGVANVLEESGQTNLFPGMCHYCPTNTFHSLRNLSDEDVVFFAVVTKY